VVKNNGRHGRTVSTKWSHNYSPHLSSTRLFSYYCCNLRRSNGTRLFLSLSLRLPASSTHEHDAAATTPIKPPNSRPCEMLPSAVADARRKPESVWHKRSCGGSPVSCREDNHMSCLGLLTSRMSGIGLELHARDAVLIYSPFLLSVANIKHPWHVITRQLLLESRLASGSGADGRSQKGTLTW
jgi:hypothetical protein